MGRLVKILFCILVLSFVSEAGAQTQPSLIAPNVFLRGIQLPEGVRYTASLVKPSDGAVLRNLSVEITLPANAILTEMLVSRQIEFDVVRQNRAGQLTLIWQISHVPAESPLDSFSFTLAQPLNAELEFYAQWQSEDLVLNFENFLELPPLVIATQSESQISLSQAGLLPAGNTGIQIAASGLGTTLTARILPSDFNPPAVYGDLWWCSLLEVTGLPVGVSTEVIVPLRRPLAPFTAVQLFQQQPDGSWLALQGQGVVTADGQYAMYTHPGGVVATGVPIEAQTEIVPASDIVVEQVDDLPPPPEQPPADNTGQIADGTSNTLLIGEVPPPTTEGQPANNLDQIADGSSNTIQLGDGSVRTIGPAPTTAGQIADGSSNTILIGEAPPPTAEGQAANNLVQIGDGSVRTIGQTPQNTPAQIADGSSNTVIIGDGSVRTIGPAPTTAGQIADGSSNTILLGESTPTFTPAPDSLAPTSVEPTPTPATVVIYTSTYTPTLELPLNPEQTDIVGDAQIPHEGTIGRPPINTAPAIPLPTITAINPFQTAADGSVRFVNASTPVQLIIAGGTIPPDGVTASATPPQSPTNHLVQIADGSSNTILLGESTPVPTVTNADGSVRGVNQTPATPPAPPPNNLVQIADGSSNTIVGGETTSQPLASPSLAATATTTPQPIPSTPFPTPVIPNPFGRGGGRVEIIVQPSGTIVQCQYGRVNCVSLRRRLGAGLR